MTTDVKISELPVAITPLVGDELIPIVQSNITRKVVASALAATVDVGTTTTGAPGTDAAVVNSGTGISAILDFTIPRGNTGATGSTGATGAAATATAGTTTTGIAGSSATVVNSGTTAAAVFDFTIPRGNTGATGATGSTGATGTAATATAGTTTTGSPGSSASVTNSGTTAAAIFDFIIPRGDVGATGATGSTGATGAPGSVWYEGSGAPSSGTGINGDYYLNVANGDVYLKATGSWSVVGNIKGPAGSGSGDVTGPSGATSGNVVLFDGATGKLIKDGGTLGTAAFTASTAYDVAGAAAAVTPTTLGLVIGTNVQAYDADLTTWAGITPGTGVGTALAINIGSAGAPVVLNGALGTPSSGTLTNCTFPTLNQDTTGKSAKTDALNSATTVVNVSSATAPSTGQVLMATSSTAATWQTPSAGDVTLNGVQTLTNKRITNRVLALAANSATPAINTDSYDIVEITSQTAAITSFTTNLTGTPVNGDFLEIRVTGTGAVALTWGTSFESSTVALPTTTVITAKLSIMFEWNSATSKWRCVGVC